MSRQITTAELSGYGYSGKPPSRPGSPLVDQDSRGLRSARHGGLNSPKDTAKKDFGSSYGAHPLSASSTATSARYPQNQRTTPTESEFSEAYDAPDAVRYAFPPALDTILTAQALGRGQGRRVAEAHQLRPLC